MQTRCSELTSSGGRAGAGGLNAPCHLVVFNTCHVKTECAVLGVTPPTPPGVRAVSAQRAEGPEAVRVGWQVHGFRKQDGF